VVFVLADTSLRADGALGGTLGGVVAVGAICYGLTVFAVFSSWAQWFVVSSYN